MTSQLTDLCAAVRYVGSGTDEMAGSLFAHQTQLQLAAARIDIFVAGDSGGGRAISAAFRAAAKACGDAATTLLRSGQLARQFAFANCATVQEVLAAAGIEPYMHLEGFESSPVSGGDFAQSLDAMMPEQAFQQIERITYCPGRREGPMDAGQTELPHDDLKGYRIELYGLPEMEGFPPMSPEQHDAIRRDHLVRAGVHEVAHVVYFGLLSDEQRQGWAAVCRDSYARGERPITTYAATAMREEFAECVVAYHFSPDKLRETGPERFAFIEAVFKTFPPRR